MTTKAFKMSCDLCGIVYDYSEDVIHHHTLIIDNKLHPHTHVCIKCETKYNLPISALSLEDE